MDFSSVTMLAAFTDWVQQISRYLYALVWFVHGKNAKYCNDGAIVCGYSRFVAFYTIQDQGGWSNLPLV